MTPNSASIEMIRCERQQMSLTKAGCARAWASTQEAKPAPWEARFKCLGCPVGAQNAGRPAGPQPCELNMICPRCRRTAMRLINQHLCVSCYNRQREVRCGRNAKGHVPRLTFALHSETLALRIQEQDFQPRTFASVLDGVEVMIAQSKAAAGPIAFGWAA